MKFYIATRLSRAAQHNTVRNALHSQGHQITYDWTLHGSVKHISTARLAEVASKELQGVVDADVVIALLPGGAGTHLELGAALALNKHVVIHSEQETPFLLGDQTCAFYHHPLAMQVITPLDQLQPLLNAATTAKMAKTEPKKCCVGR